MQVGEDASVAMLSVFLVDRREQDLPFDSPEPLLPPGLVSSLATRHKGSLTPLLSWLHDKVLQQGRVDGSHWDGLFSAMDAAKTQVQRAAKVRHPHILDLRKYTICMYM